MNLIYKQRLDYAALCSEALQKALNELNETLTKPLSELKKVFEELNETVNKGLNELT